jgi:hypothetical protein
MNDMRRFRDHAAESLLLAKNCQTGYRDLFFLYPVHVMTRKSFGLMMRKLSVTESR